MRQTAHQLPTVAVMLYDSSANTSSNFPALFMQQPLDESSLLCLFCKVSI